ncbi:N-alpha-acetyltransferase 60 isoform X2 [Onthophagus taurus]|uniref:N-alpha-acetyltransferase 60 isoform X2 n=1 Tax=Onthophagus taurus TaxID=166361 RepID=UPI000C20EBF9|nr:N-alpha-acetyltransferase 60 isoform X2 [Onthophagus taurus]
MAGPNWYQNNGCELTSQLLVDAKVPLYSLADVQLRFLCPNDLDEVRALCQDWFPIEYPYYWYEEITSSNRFFSLAAVHERRIIGLIVAEIKPYDSLNPEDTGILAKSLSEHAHVGYILSLGVAKDYRRNGIASLLLDSFLRYLVTPEKKKVKAVFLHVLTSNTAAIMFYESRKFQLHSFLPYYYAIKGRCKDGFTYVLYINGGHPPRTLYDYIKYVCVTLFRGGGLFPWLVGNVSKALGWIWTSQTDQEHHIQQQSIEQHIEQ